MQYYSSIVINGRFLEQKMTGVQRFAFETVCALDNLFKDLNNKNIPVYLAVSKNVNLSKLPDLKNIQIKKIGRLTGIPWAQTELSKFIKKQNALGIHLCNAVPLLNPKGIVCIHDISYKIHPEFVTTKKHQLIRLWHLIQNHVSIKKSLEILTVSEWSKKEISEVYKVLPDKITVVYNGWQHFKTEYSPSTSLEKFPFLKHKDFFYSMSSLGKNKNFDWILEEARKNPDMTFAVAGNSDLKKYGETINNKNELKNLFYLGYVSDDEAKLLMKECKAFIFPSIYEGFGIPPLEALAMGSQVICSNAVCLPEIFKDSVHYIDPYKHDINLNTLLSEKTEPAEKVLSLYSWEKTAEKTFEIICKYFN